MLYKEIPSNPTLNLTGLSYLSEERHFFSALGLGPSLFIIFNNDHMGYMGHMDYNLLCAGPLKKS